MRESTATVVELTVNRRKFRLEIEPRVSLLDALREYAGMSGTKKGCNQGACGACTVLVDGQRINSCLALAVAYQGREITTIEGLSESAHDLHPMQQSFLENDGFQCGYCTPGQVCSSLGMLEELRRGVPSAVSADLSGESHPLTQDELKERMSGNLCRCGAYTGICQAIWEGAQQSWEAVR